MSAPTSSRQNESLRILIVENHSDTLRYLQMYLEQLGHKIDVAKTMHEGLAAAQTADLDVLISDIGLPDGDGWELMRSAEFKHPVYAIAMSGYGMEADRAKSIKAGFKHHLLKPFLPDELNDMLEEAIRERRTRA
ncbi:MAG: response regulator [Verrucomicrobia bacterium]|nr:response regulator [Verrucomicrobiota bacterium]MBV9673983.1 response regulator [Verrucomicrobiota bacterium]